LGAVILQDSAPVAYYSRKLNAAQKNYTVGEKEILSVVETLKKYRTMLYGCQNLYVYTDHKNNTFHNLQTQRVLRWRLFLEDFAVKFIYIKGDMNTLADALSRLPFNERQNPSSLYALQNLSDSPVNNPRSRREADDDPLEIAHAHTSMADDADLIDCFVHLPPAEHVQFVLTYQMITQAQQGDALCRCYAQVHLPPSGSY
jgi:hypothetical protein